ncbi:MAG: ABC transporter permease [Bacteroidota bacterium]
MRTISIIFQREYLQRVRSKGFILATLLGPVALLLLMVLPVLTTVWVSDDSTRQIAVVDETEQVAQRLQLPDRYELVDPAPEDTLRERVLAGTLDGYLLLPAGVLSGEAGATYYSKSGGGGLSEVTLSFAIEDAVRNQRVLDAGASEEVIELMDSSVKVERVKLTEEGEAADQTGFMIAVGYFMGFLIYVCMFLYGTLVMRGVIEEKNSRIMEVVVSSAKPFELMMGKVLGIGAMGLTQFVAWILLSVAALAGAGPLIALFLDPSDYGLTDSAEAADVLAAADISIPTLPISLFVYFLLFFLAGYLLYASLFAAVGSAVEQESDAQQFFLPVSMPVILAIVFMFQILDKPDSTFSVVLSLIPLFSPILMPARAAVTAVPFWQIALSLILVLAAFLGAVWLGARIYRVGVLMYGKKPTFKDLIKWVRYA